MFEFGERVCEVNNYDQRRTEFKGQEGERCTHTKETGGDQMFVIENGQDGESHHRETGVVNIGVDHQAQEAVRGKQEGRSVKQVSGKLISRFSSVIWSIGVVSQRQRQRQRNINMYNRH